MKVKDLKPNPLNPRKITDQKARMLSKSMKEFGDLSGVVFNCRTGQVVGGHQRIKHLDPEWGIVKKKTHDSVGTVAVGYIITPKGNWSYREVDWPKKKETAANIAANQHGADFDIPALKNLVMEVGAEPVNVELMGFNEKELSNLLGNLSENGSVPPKDPNIFVRLSFHPSIWLGKREEIQKIFKQMTKTYSCKVSVDE